MGDCDCGVAAGIWKWIWNAISNIFESFGATAVGIFPGRTSQQAGGNKAGVQVRFTNDDIDLLQNNVPLCKHVVRMSQKIHRCKMEIAPSLCL